MALINRHIVMLYVFFHLRLISHTRTYSRTRSRGLLLVRRRRRRRRVGVREVADGRMGRQQVGIW